jgi:hypothetical protein
VPASPGLVRSILSLAAQHRVVVRVRVPVLVTLGSAQMGGAWCSISDQRRVPSANEDASSLPGEDAVLLLLFGLLRSGQVVLRRIVGWQDMPAVTLREKAA